MGWADKYAPEEVGEVVGQGKAVDKFLEWYDSWETGDDAALLHGGPGTGKTSLVHSLAKERNLDIVEVNASDTRNRDSIEELLGGATKQHSLLRQGKIILVDEVDGLSGNADRGGVSAMIDIIKDSSFPVVLTANDPYDQSLRSLRNHVEMISFGKVHLNSMTARLREICEEEGVECEDSVLKHIARTAGGDMRAALKDLEALARGRDEVTRGDMDMMGYREKEDDIFEALKVIFKTETMQTAVDAADGIDKDPDELFWWLEENIPREYEKPEEVARAFDALSRADVFQSRIHVNQNWRFMKYQIDTMCGGVALAKDEPYRSFTKYSPPKRFKQYARTRGKRNKMKEICEKLGSRVHASSSTIHQDYLPLFSLLLGRTEDFEKQLIRWGLSEDEIEAIRKL